MRAASYARILLALLCLLTLATSASAECAWVKWKSGALPTSGDEVWGVIGAYSAEDGGWKRASESFASKRNKALENDEKAKRYMRSLICFPDTVDPRGPKGK